MNTAPARTFNARSLFSFNVYSDRALKVRAGAAVFTCQYNFQKNAFCDAAFKLKNGETFIAEGAFNFEATSFELAVTGSYGFDENATGYVKATPSINHAQKLAFHLK